MSPARERVVVGPGAVVTTLALVLGAALSAWGFWDAVMRAPIEVELKLTQKIVYFHAPLGMWTILACVVAAGAGIAYLWKRDPKADLLSAACVETSLVTCAIVLVTGSLWAKPAWGDWFPWGEPRVTGMLVLFLLLVAYSALRTSVDEPERRGRFSAVVAIMGAAVALIAYLAVIIWQSTHPRIISGEGIAMQADMKRAFLTCMAGTACLVFAIVLLRYRVSVLALDVERLEHEADERMESR